MKPCVVAGLVGVATFIGCSKSEKSSAKETQEAKERSPTSGRVTLVTHDIEAGAPDQTAIEAGLKTATTVLDELLETDELRLATGTFIGRFRIEPDGSVRMFMTDEATSIANADSSQLEERFVGAIFGGTLTFSELGDRALVYAEFAITPPK